MGLTQRLRRSFRSKARKEPPAAVPSSSTAVPSAAGRGKKPAPVSAGAAVKPAPPTARPPASDAKTAAAAAPAILANGGVGCGCGGGDSGVGGGSSGIGGSGGGGGGGDKGCDSGVSVPAPRSVAADGSTKRGTTAGTVSVLETDADAVTIKQLAAQIKELRSELVSLRVTVKSLESRMSQTVPRRLPRANSYQPETRSLVTSTLSLEEGPNCVLKADEFYDAMTISLLHLEEESEKRNELRKKKDEEIQEELRRQKEGSSENSKEINEENSDSSRGDERQEEDNERTKSTDGKSDADNESRDVEKTNNAMPSDASQRKEDQQTPATAKPAPEKPSRSLSKGDSSSVRPETERAVTAARVKFAATPQPPLAPAAAPRGGCSGNCSQLGHPLAAEIERIVTEQLELVAADVTDGWSLFAQQGDMLMYKLEAPADGLTVEPLKAVSKAHGVSARELCRNYWDTNVRLEWETTVDRVTVLARPDPSTVLCHQLHRRVWPTQQRDAVFWSHLCRRRLAGREWSIAVNHSVSGHPAEPPVRPGTVRAVMTSALAGRDEEAATGDRRRLHCHVAYSSHVDPGGWVPTAGLKLVYKREYPRFLQRFTGYVSQKSRGQPVEV